MAGCQCHSCGCACCWAAGLLSPRLRAACSLLASNTSATGWACLCLPLAGAGLHVGWRWAVLLLLRQLDCKRMCAPIAATACRQVLAAAACIP